MRHLTRQIFHALAFVAMALLGAAMAQAQEQPGGIVLEKPESALRCLQPEAAKLAPVVYPADELLLNRGATVRVRLTFTDPASEPKVVVYYNLGSDAFADAVKEAVHAYRLPCLPPGATPVIATQTFSFVPHDGQPVVRSRVIDEETSELCRFIKEPQQPPLYPLRGIGPTSDSGSVIMSMTFTAKDKPPTTQVLFTAGGSRFVRAAEAFVSEYRVDCPPPYAPIKARQAFRFHMEGTTQYGLKNMNLKQFVGVIDKLEQQQVRFDLNTMGCPFDLRFGLYQPYASNEIGEVARTDPNRREFIDWLSRVALKLPREAHEQVIGSTFTLAVPCGTLDLM